MMDIVRDHHSANVLKITFLLTPKSVGFMEYLALVYNVHSFLLVTFVGFSVYYLSRARAGLGIKAASRRSCFTNSSRKLGRLD